MNRITCKFQNLTRPFKNELTSLYYGCHCTLIIESLPVVHQTSTRETELIYIGISNPSPYIKRDASTFESRIVTNQLVLFFRFNCEFFEHE